MTNIEETEIRAAKILGTCDNYLCRALDVIEKQKNEIKELGSALDHSFKTELLTVEENERVLAELNNKSKALRLIKELRLSDIQKISARIRAIDVAIGEIRAHHCRTGAAPTEALKTVERSLLETRFGLSGLCDGRF